MIGRRRDLEARLARVEAKLDLLLEQAGIPYDPASRCPAGVMEALAQGRKIEAIRLYRQGTGAGLAEAKRAVDSLDAGA